MRLAYLDCFAGVSGELILGALIDAGLSLDVLRSELARLSLPYYTIEAQPIAVRGFTGVQVVVSSTSAYHPHSLVGDPHSTNGIPSPPESGAQSPSYTDLVPGADLPPEVKRRSLAALKLLHDAERSSLPLPSPPSPSDDALRDTVLIIAAVSGFALLGVQNVACSPVNVGGGIAFTGHNVMPIPSPTVARILQTASVPIYGTETNHDLVTPVGAALVVALSTSFGAAPAMPVSALGHALSGVPTTPGLRVILGDLRGQEDPARLVPITVGDGLASPIARFEADRVILLEATLDDTNPQYYDFVVERLLRQGAEDVYLVPAQLKTNHPGAVLSVICSAGRSEALCEVVFEETGAESIRISDVPRRTVHSEVVEVPTSWGSISAKIGRNSEGRLLHVKPDYEQVKRVALKNRVPVENVYEEVRSAYAPAQSDLHQHPGRQRFPQEHLPL